LIALPRHDVTALAPGAVSRSIKGGGAETPPPVICVPVGHVTVAERELRAAMFTVFFA
jgi:hypothetical protein